jgi:hypothetical protein
MILRPTARFLTRPFPPARFAARFLAAVIRPPLLFFAIRFSPYSHTFWKRDYCIGRRCVLCVTTHNKNIPVVMAKACARMQSRRGRMVAGNQDRGHQAVAMTEKQDVCTPPQFRLGDE